MPPTCMTQLPLCHAMPLTCMAAGLLGNRFVRAGISRLLDSGSPSLDPHPWVQPISSELQLMAYTDNSKAPAVLAANMAAMGYNVPSPKIVLMLMQNLTLKRENWPGAGRVLETDATFMGWPQADFPVGVNMGNGSGFFTFRWGRAVGSGDGGKAGSVGDEGAGGGHVYLRGIRRTLGRLVCMLEGS